MTAFDDGRGEVMRTDVCGVCQCRLAETRPVCPCDAADLEAEMKKRSTNELIAEAARRGERAAMHPTSLAVDHVEAVAEHIEALRAPAVLRIPELDHSKLVELCAGMVRDYYSDLDADMDLDAIRDWFEALRSELAALGVEVPEAK